MTPAESIAKALERLTDEREFAWVNAFEEYGGDPWPLDTALAALIRTCNEPFKVEHELLCPACGNPQDDHLNNCALIALCDAINGEKQ